MVVISPAILSSDPGWAVVGLFGVFTIDMPSKEGAMTTAPQCEACGMTMSRPSQHGNGNSGGRFCIYCTDLAGNLKPRSEIREGMIQYTMKLESWTREQAEQVVDMQLSQLPAWRKQSGPAVRGEQTSSLY